MVNVVELQKQLQRWQHSGNVNVNVDANGELTYVKVMTDEQLETLRKQIAVYSTICDQLIQMHTTLSAQQDLAGVRLGNIYCDPLMTSGGHKITSRQRWTPTPVQLQILERLFDQGNGTPSKEKIKDITAQLGQHGQISETNVYNWFQNRRARSKRKLQNVAPSSNTESEVDTIEVDSKDKKTKPEEFQSQSQHNIATTSEKLCFRNPQVYSDLHYLNPDSNKPYSMFQSDGSLKSSRNFSHVSVFDEVLSNSRSDYVGEKMEVGGGSVSYNLFHQTGDCNLAG